MKSKLIQGVVFVDLSADGLVDGKPFEALTIGSFIDMSGKSIEITLERLQRIVERTRAALQAKIDTSGEIVGFPIDAKGHENGDAAGWIVGIELAGTIIKLLPRWTELGIEKISKKIQRLFSCTIDTESDTIVGGSLTNWPAVHGLDQVELSSHLFQLKPPNAAAAKKHFVELMLMVDESYGEAEARVIREFIDEYQEDNPGSMFCPYPVNVYADYLVVRVDGELTKVPYTDDNGTITFADDAEWKPVRMVPVEMPASTEDVAELQRSTAEELDMTIEELMALLAANNKTLLAQLAAQNGKPVADAGAAVISVTAGAQPAKVDPAVASLIGLEGLREKLVADMQVVMQSELDSVKARSANMFAATLAELHEKNRVSEFARSMTDGTKGARALPVSQAKVEEVLLTLNPKQREAVEGILGEVVKTGLVDFSERGVRGEGKRLKVLPKEVAAYLEEGLKVADLQTPIMKPVLAEHGVMNLQEYDLSKWPAASPKVEAGTAQGEK